jgi:hypothetical protein
MRVARWLNDSPTRYWNQPIIYQKKRELAFYHWHNLWALPISGVKAAVAAVSVLAVCRRPAESGSKRADRVWNWNSTRDCSKIIDFENSFPQIGIHQS